MEISKKRYQALVSRTRGAISSAKDAGIAGLVGFGGYYLHRELASRVDFVAQNWYAGPLAMIAGGFLLRRKAPFAAGALCGAGGYAAGFGYSMNQASKNAQGFDAGAFDAGLVQHAFEPVSAYAPELPQHAEPVVQLTPAEAAMMGIR